MARELSSMLRCFQERYDRAVQDGDVDLLSRSCPGKHGRWGRICVLDVGHEAEYPHLGTNSEGQPVAWVGTAPDDDCLPDGRSQATFECVPPRPRGVRPGGGAGLVGGSS